MSSKPRDVLNEPEPVSRAWAILRKELGFYPLHDHRQLVYDVIAHEVAQEIRRERDEADTPGSPATPDFIRGMTYAAGFVDPHDGAAPVRPDEERGA